MFLQPVHCRNVIQRCLFSPPSLPCVLHECSHQCFHLYTACGTFFLPPPLPSPLAALPSATPSHLLLFLVRPGPVLRFCQEIETDRRVKRVSCRAAASASAAAAAEALLLRGCDLDNQEELERLQALEPLQLQQCQEGVSCVTRCPI